MAHWLKESLTLTFSFLFFSSIFLQQLILVFLKILFIPLLLLKLLSGVMLGLLILPAFWLTLPKETHYSFKVKTKDNIKLDTWMIKYKEGKEEKDFFSNNLPTENTYYIINFLGNKQIYEHVWNNNYSKNDEKRRNFFKFLSKSYSCTIISVFFNPRGTGKSTGILKSSDDLSKDGKRQVDFLLEKGVPPKQIILFGLSLGGSIAVLTKTNFFLHNEIKVFADRTFSKLSDVIISYKKIFLPVSIINKILWLTKWEIDTITAFDKIKDSQKAVTASENDSVIVPEASLFQKSSLTEWKITYATTSKNNPVIAPGTPVFHIEKGQKFFLQTRENNSHAVPFFDSHAAKMFFRDVFVLWTGLEKNLDDQQSHDLFVLYCC